MRLIDHFADLLIGQTEEVSEQQLGPQAMGELAQASVQRTLLRDSILLHHGVGFSDERLQIIDRRGCLPESLQQVQAAVVGNATQPAPQAATSPEATDPLHGLQEHLLANILGLLGVTEDPDGEGRERVAIDRHQKLERLVQLTAAHERERLGLAGVINTCSRRFLRQDTRALGGRRIDWAAIRIRNGDAEAITRALGPCLRFFGLAPRSPIVVESWVGCRIGFACGRTVASCS